MKQRILLFVFAALTATLSALADETIQLSNRKLSLTESWSHPSSHFNNTSGNGSVSWDATTRTLTLNNFSLDRTYYASATNVSGTGHNCIIINSTKRITIEVKGRNYLKTNDFKQTLELHGNTTFTGDGYLHIYNIQGDGWEKPDIDLLEENLTVTVDGPELYLDSDNGIRGKNNTGTLYLKSGIINQPFYSKQLLKNMGGVIFDYGMGVQKPHGAYFSPQKHTFVDKDGNEARGLLLGPIEYYGFRINGVEITANNYDLINTWNTVKSGSVKYVPSSNKLYLAYATLHNSSAYPTIENDKNDRLDIFVQGENKFTFEGTKEREVLYLKRNTMLEGHESIGSSLKATSDFAGIYVASGQTLTIKEVDVKVPWLAGGNAFTDLKIGSYVEIEASGSSKGTVRQLRINNVSDKPGIAVVSSKTNPRFIWNRSSMPGVYKDQSYVATGIVKLSTKNVEWYNRLSICGYPVNSLNKDNPVNEYVKSGSLVYNSSSNTLTMENASIDYYDGAEDAAVIKNWHPSNSYVQNLNIKVKGTNTIKADKAQSICANWEAILSGDGVSMSSLTVKGDNAKVSTNHYLRVRNMTATMPEVEAYTLAVDDSKLSITRQADTRYCSLNLTKLASTPEAPAYLTGADGEKTLVAPEGPVNFVPESQVTIYPIRFCGEEINSANASYVMSEYIKAGAMSVEKVSNGYSITLGWMGVSYFGSYPVFDFFSTDNISLNIEGINQFKLIDVDDYGSAEFIRSGAKNLYINGGRIRPSLSVLGSKTTNTGAIEVGENSSLYFYKNSSEFGFNVPRIYGWSATTSNLYVYDPYVTVSGNNQGTVSNIKCHLSSRTELYSTLSTPREIRDMGIYSGDNICTEEVKFVKPGESYINVDEVMLDKNDLTFTGKGMSAQLTASVLPADATNPSLVWESQDESVAKVDRNGKVTSVGKGNTQIIAYPAESDHRQFYRDWNDLYFYNVCNVTVTLPEPTDISLDLENITFEWETVSSIYIRATLTPTDAETELTWTSSDENIVSVKSNSGRLARIDRMADEGEATITVTTSNGLSASCKAIIKYKQLIMVEDIAFDQPNEVHLSDVGQTLQINATVTPTDATEQTLSWFVNNTSVGTISETGLFTATGYGVTNVAAFSTDGSEVYKSIRVYVDEPPVIATNLNLPSIDPFYQLGDQFILVPEFTPENVTNDALEWVSTDPNVATVDENGIVTIVGWGECFINATTTDGSNIKRSCWIQAFDPSSQEESIYATGIKLEQKEVTLLVGSETRVGVTIEPANYTESIMVELMEGDISVAEVREEWDWNTNRTSIYIRSDQMMGQAGDVKYVIRPNAADWEKLNAMGIWEEPKDTLTIHIINPIIFAEASPEDINVTYHVTDINDKTCEVYSDFNEMMPEPDPELNETFVTPAVDISATGLLTIPARANGYWVTNVRERAFQKCSGLTEIEFSEGIATIGDFACYRRLSSLQRVTLPSTIEELGMYCFAGSYSDYSGPTGAHSNLREVNIKAFTPPTGLNGNSIDWSSAFDCIAEDAVLYVPVGALEAYNTTPWTEWFSRIEEKAFFEDQDGLKDLRDSKDLKEHSWFDLSGRKLGSKPAKPGLYIQNGRKFVIK